MQFHAIQVQGNILSAELLAQIQSEQQGVGQSPKDFWLDPGTKVRDEIQRAWADVKDQYQIFRRRQEKIKDGDTGRADTRKYWMLDFLDYLGYKLESSPDETLNGKTYKISHRVANLDGLPVHIAGIKESLDRKPEGRQSMSPHAMVQEYLNVTEHVYGLVTNGAQLRLLRDSSRLTRISYLEFDLIKILEEDRYADFALLYRVLHASRMPRMATDALSSLIERYHTDSLAAGSRIREKLSGSVEFAILTFGNGFLKHPANEALRTALVTGQLTPDKLYDELLRLIYRLLFLMVTEERNLIYPEPEDRQPLDPKEAARRQIYYQYYAVNRVRQLAEKRLYDQQRYTDLWEGVMQTFRLFEAGDRGKALGVQPLAGDLFSSNALAYLGDCRLDNESLLRAVFLLSAFENEQRQIIRVNYAALDVEEFGSVYEGLLEYQPTVDQQPWEFRFVKGKERASSGSHYTPDELVHPLIKHSLDHLIEERLQKDPTGESLLTLKVADVACGSGHILLAAARRIALKLSQARTQEDQPAPGPYRRALREVVQHCIYGVDKNPLAVELCKVALWLEAHNPGQPLNFLDHRIRCGDAIVGVGRAEDLDKGIPDEAFKTLPGDDKEVSARLRTANKAARKGMDAIRKANQTELLQRLSALGADWKSLDTLEENTVEAVEAKRRHFQNLRTGAQWWRLKQLADIATAQFFIPKTPENETLLSTEEDFRNYSSGRKSLQTLASAKAVAVSCERRFFHWFLEFPEVMAQGGFDCILGNPPFLGGKKISTLNGVEYNNWIKSMWEEKGSADLVAFFLRRIFEIINSTGYQSLITTNTICQGDTREVALDVILNKKGKINFAIKSMKWPGLAAVEISLVSITKNKLHNSFYLNNKYVESISSYFEDTLDIGFPFRLKANVSKSFKGVYVFGPGFILSTEEAKILKHDEQNSKVIFPYLVGEDFNGHPEQKAQREIINFFDYTENEARKYHECFRIVELKVKPQREAFLKTSNQIHELSFWKYWDKRPNLMEAIKGLDRVLISCTVSKHLSVDFAQTNQVFDIALNVIAYNQYFHFLMFQSSIHSIWAWKYGSTMKTDLRYTPSTCIETFPFPPDLTQTDKQNLEQIGQAYYENRRALLLGIWMGLTKTYNIFHARNLPQLDQVEKIFDIGQKEIEKQYGKDCAYLLKHLGTCKEATYNIQQALTEIQHLRILHVEMDQAVIIAYGWRDIQLRHDFYEVDYLPENDRVRFTIHPDARREVLKRLLELNHKIYAEEVAQGLHDKKKTKTIKADSDGEQQINYPGEQGKLFEDGGKQGKLF
jgi:methylase of polypeptide subunit release factors